MAVPFQDYSDFFQPEEIEAFTAAYNAAWLQLWATGRTFSTDQESVTKRNLTRMILASACKGERDIERLKELHCAAFQGELKVAQSSVASSIDRFRRAAAKLRAIVSR